MGALLIPNKPIYRRKGEEEYYIYFSRETVESITTLSNERQSIKSYIRTPTHTING